MFKFLYPPSSTLPEEESPASYQRLTSAEFKERRATAFKDETIERTQKTFRREWINNAIDKMMRKKNKKKKGKKLYPKLKKLTEEYIKRLFLSMTIYCDAMHENGLVPYETRHKQKDCTLSDIARKIDNFLSDTPKGYLMLTGPEVIGLTFGPEAQEQYEQFLDQDVDEEAGHGVDEDDYAGYGVGLEEEPEKGEPEEKINWDQVDGGKRRKTKRRKSMKRKIRTKKNKRKIISKRRMRK